MHLNRLILTACACAAALLNTACGGGGSEVLGNPPTVANASQTSGQVLSFAYFQRCIQPILLAQLPSLSGGGSNTCAGSGCHDNSTGTGGALRLFPAAAVLDVTDPANTAAVIRASDMYKNFYSSQAASVIGSSAQSRLLSKPLLRGVLHQRSAHGLLGQPPRAPGSGRIQHCQLRHVHAQRPQHRQLQHAMNAYAQHTRVSPRTSWSLCLLAGLALCASALCHAAEPAIEPATDVEPVQITEPYIELHTGPGRGFPVFFVSERGQWIDITLRHTDWYKVRTAEGKVGWVHRHQLESTLTDAGQTRTFRDLLLDDYLSRRVQAGAAWGQFSSAPMLKVWSSYRLSDTLSAEATLGQVQGTFSGTSFWHVNLLSEPWSDHRISPFFGIGLGRMSNVPNASLVDATRTDAQIGNATLGVRYYVSDRFVLRGDYTLYTGFVSDSSSLEFRALTAGISFFF